MGLCGKLSPLDYSINVSMIPDKKNAKSEKGLFCYDKSGWGHAMFISE